MGKHLDEFDNITLNVLGYIKYVKDELGKKNCRNFEVGWYCKDDITDHTGIVLLINGKKKLALAYIIEEYLAYQSSAPNPSSQSVE